MLTMVRRGGRGENGGAAARRARVHSTASWGAGVWTPLAHPPTKWEVFGPVGGLTTTLKRGAPAPQCPPLRKSKPSVNVASTVISGTPVMRAPAEDQTRLGSVFDSSRPRCGSFAVSATPLDAVAPPLSGKPMTASHPDVTWWL